MNLKQWPSGTGAEITTIEGDSGFVSRLRDLGLFNGVHVEVILSLPFSGPLIIRAHGATFALRQGEAQCIQVQALKTSS